MAGSVCRDELYDILCEKFKPEVEFVRGARDRCIYRCRGMRVTLLHHVDDVRCTGPTATLNWPIENSSHSIAKSRPAH